MISAPDIFTISRARIELRTARAELDLRGPPDVPREPKRLLISSTARLVLERGLVVLL